MNDLFEKLQSDFEKAVEAHYEAQKRQPVSLRIGKHASLQTAAEEWSLAALRRVRNNRAHAVATDPEARLEFAALAIAAREAKKSLVEVVSQLAEILPNWTQSFWRPSDDAGTVPLLPIDPTTGLRIRNPFEPLPPRKGETEPRFDYHSQETIRAWSPRLAKWLEDCAKNGGPTAGMLDELEAERREAERLRKLEYSDKQWQENALRPGSGKTLTEENLFVKGIEDPWLLSVHRKEAKAGSPRLHFDNLTHRMQIAKKSPELREVHKKAGEILKQWQQEPQEKAAA